MGIPESQLETWAGQGSVTQSANTYQTVKNALEASDADHAGRDFTVFLQGSYGNDTNIYAESDVDIVIQLTQTFYSNKSELTESAKRTYDATFATATYQLEDFKRDVLATLKRRFASDVEGGTKAIAIKQNGNRRKADVIVATEYRRYSDFTGEYGSNYKKGIRFLDSSGNEIINYPKVHSANLTAKHQRTSSRFKPMVRILKNARTRMVNAGTIQPGSAPSYYIEGMLYNVPDSLFTYRYDDSLPAALNWLNKTDRSQLLCANEQYYLLRDNSPVCWRPSDGEAFLRAVIGFWNNW